MCSTPSCSCTAMGFATHRTAAAPAPRRSTTSCPGRDNSTATTATSKVRDTRLSCNECCLPPLPQSSLSTKREESNKIFGFCASVKFPTSRNVIGSAAVEFVTVLWIFGCARDTLLAGPYLVLGAPMFNLSDCGQIPYDPG